ncbi:helix-turn-helix domain-containing protein [Flavobacterium sp. XS2P12]|uniref:helix-turn-helix domain-containing protein n=1 Tax=Flavobacterium melibiosi TaxID=3398734 RepID=UPI003A871F2E
MFKNIKQRDVVYGTGLDVENLKKHIKGKQEIKISAMMKIVNSLNINGSDLFEE